MNRTIYRLYIGSFILIGILVIVAVGYEGYSYYLTPLKERVYHTNHKMFKPSGLIGHGLGIIGTLMMLFGVAIYMIRKRVKKLMRLGVLKHWLELHIFLCTVGPFLVLFHTSFKFGGIVSVSFWSMVAVVLSGVIGRFIYIQIPRTIQGQELSMNEIKEMDIDLNKKLREEYSVNEKTIAEINGYVYQLKSGSSLFSSMLLVVKSWFVEKKYVAKVKKSLRMHKVDNSVIRQSAKIVKNKLVLQRRMKILSSMQKLFKYWHVAHLPFALVMFGIMVIHVSVTIVFGYRWVF